MFSAVAAYAQDNQSSGMNMGDTSDEGMSGMDPATAMDAPMTTETYDELRAVVAKDKDYTDEEMRLTMTMMSPSFEVYVSDESVRAEVGVLIVAHGFHEIGDQSLVDRLKPTARIFPTAAALGMSMMQSSHIQSSVDSLVAAGAKKIIAIPVHNTPYSNQTRQWLYILGKLDKPGYATVPQVQTSAEIIVAEPLKDHPFMAELLTDYAKEISTDPSNEVVIIGAHGQAEMSDNQSALAEMANLAKYVQEDGGFSEVKVTTLQNDAPQAIRNVNVERLRGWVATAKQEGKQALVVPYVIAPHSVQGTMRKELEGLDYKFNAKGVIEHPNFDKWLSENIRVGFQENR